MTTIELWHDIISAGDPSRFDELLTEDCVFLSPVVHTPQKGREITKLYLGGAMMTFNESFHYVKEVVTPEHAVLEFHCIIDGTEINGVDILSFDERGLIYEIKVMVRPLQAINLLHQKMQALLGETGSAGSHSN